jgi:ankyrin repeat protein
VNVKEEVMRSAVLSSVLGILLLLSSCGTAPVATGGDPGSSDVSVSGGEKYGFEVVSGPGPVENGRSSITVTANRELELMAFMQKKGEAGGNALIIPVEPLGVNTWVLDIVFPEVAEYTVTLMGKAADGPGDSYDLSAEWTVQATSSAAAVASIDSGNAGKESADQPWFTEYPSLKKYGIEILEAPRESSVGHEIVIAVSSDEEVELSASVWRPGSKSSISGATEGKKSNGTWRYTVRFPETGDFDVTLSARGPDDEERYYYGVAKWSLHAEVPAGKEWTSPSERRMVETAKPKKDIEAELNDAVDNDRVDEIREWLKGCGSTDTWKKRGYMNALKSLLFETGPEKTSEAMNLLAAAGMDPNLRGEEEWPILATAVSNNRIDVARWLLERGADVNARNQSGTTSLHALASPMDNSTTNHREWLDLFLRYGVDLDPQNEMGHTPLIYAAMSDSRHDILVALVEAGSDYNIGDNEGNAPLSHAWQRGQKKNTEYLKSKEARLYSYRFPTKNEAVPCRAVLEGDAAAVRSLPLEEFGEMIARTSMLIPATPLHLAAERGGTEVLRALCSRGVDWNVPDRYGRSPLQLAIMEDRPDVVSLLLDYGANPNYSFEENSTPFTVACSVNTEIALEMIDKGFLPEGEDAARAAIGSENLELVKALGKSVEWGYSELDFAADIGQVEILEYLGSNVELSTKEPVGPFVEKARENRRRDREYRMQAERPLDAPRRDGGIGEKRGNFPYALESWSPWLEHDEVDLADYPVGIYVPEHYDGTKPFGLVVSITNAKSSSRYPRHFEQTLDDHNLIWIGFDPYNGLHRIGGHANKAFCLAAVYNMLGYYNIDQSRIYIGGYSLGGQLTERILRTHPRIFDGAFFINISYSGGPTKDPAWYYCKHNLPIVTVEGDYDYNRAWAYKAYDELLCSGYENIYFFHEPMKGHKLISAESFETIVQLLEAGER